MHPPIYSMNAREIDRHARYLTRARTGIRAATDAFELDFAYSMWLSGVKYEALPQVDKDQLRECWEDQRKVLLRRIMPGALAG